MTMKNLRWLWWVTASWRVWLDFWRLKGDSWDTEQEVTYPQLIQLRITLEVVKNLQSIKTNKLPPKKKPNKNPKNKPLSFQRKRGSTIWQQQQQKKKERKKNRASKQNQNIILLLCEKEDICWIQTWRYRSDLMIWGHYYRNKDLFLKNKRRLWIQEVVAYETEVLADMLLFSIL